MSFVHPWVLLLLLVLPIVWYGARRRPRREVLVYSDLARLLSAASFGRARWRRLPMLTWYLAAALLIVALARPQERNVTREISAPGIDIALVLDMSSSMLHTDFRPNRFEAARSVLKRFIGSRTTDRIALIIFAGRAYTQLPLTFDYQAAHEMIDALAIGQLEDGTAIGMGLAEAVNRLRSSEAKSRIIVLLTDGVNNRGRIDPKTAGEIARLQDVRVYTVGMGLRRGGVQAALEERLGIADETVQNIELLKQIASDTGGRYFDAATLRDLSAVYDTIGALEKSDVKLNEFVTVREWYGEVLQLAGLLFVFGWLLDLTVLRRIP